MSILVLNSQGVEKILSKSVRNKWKKGKHKCEQKTMFLCVYMVFVLIFLIHQLPAEHTGKDLILEFNLPENWYKNLSFINYFQQTSLSSVTLCCFILAHVFLTEFLSQ